MLMFWKAVSIVLFVAVIGAFLVDFSMFWWPNIPSSPDPAEGRVYPLNNHSRYTYMNKREHDLQQLMFVIFFLGGSAFALIHHFVDPFDYKHQCRPLRPAPPWEQMK